MSWSSGLLLVLLALLARLISNHGQQLLLAHQHMMLIRGMTWHIIGQNSHAVNLHTHVKMDIDLRPLIRRCRKVSGMAPIPAATTNAEYLSDKLILGILQMPWPHPSLCASTLRYTNKLSFHHTDGEARQRKLRRISPAGSCEALELQCRANSLGKLLF